MTLKTELFSKNGKHLKGKHKSVNSYKLIIAFRWILVIEIDE